jgi:hypothetical protein
MTYQFSAEAATLTDKCRSLFGDESRWITADGYTHSLALAVIDSIFSTGSHYQSVIDVVNKYPTSGLPPSQKSSTAKDLTCCPSSIRTSGVAMSTGATFLGWPSSK